MKTTKNAVYLIWGAMIGQTLICWYLALFYISASNNPLPAESATYVSYAFAVVALVLAGFGKYYHERGNSRDELLARSAGALSKRPIAERQPNVLHGYLVKSVFSWVFVDAIAVLGIIAAVLPLSYYLIHSFCGASVVVHLWLRPDGELMEELERGRCN